MAHGGGTTRVLATLVVIVRVALVLALIAVVVPLVAGEPGVLDRLLRRTQPVDSWTEASVVFTRDGATPKQRRELRSQLQAHLSHHAALSVRFMRATVADDPGFVASASDVLVGNTEDLRSTLEPAIGAERAARFAGQWEQLTSQLFRYAAGVRDTDDTARDQAREELATMVDDLAALLDNATRGRLSAGVTATTLQQQIDLLLFQIDAYGARNYAQAYALQREAFATMYGFGETIATAAAGRNPQRRRPTPREEVAASITLLLDEHVAVSNDVVRAGANGSSEFGAAAATLDANSSDLTHAMSSLLGGKRAQQFNRRWVSHINLLMRYAAAVAENDIAARTRLQRRLDTTMRGFGPALAKATGGRIPKALLTNGMTTHQYQMLDQISAFVAADYEQAHESAYDAYTHMHGVANRLGHALGAAVVDELPRGGAATGGGGTASSRS